MTESSQPSASPQPSTSSQSAASAQASALDVGSAPRTGPAARPALVVICLGLFAMAGLAGYEVYVRLSAGTGPLASLLGGGISPAEWTALPWVAGLVVAVGVALVVAAVKPTRPSHLGYGSSLWLTPTAVARLCSAQARTVAGVGDATTTVGRRRVTVVVSVSGREPAEINREVRQAVTPVLDEVSGDRELAVRVDMGAQR